MQKIWAIMLLWTKNHFLSIFSLVFPLRFLGFIVSKSLIRNPSFIYQFIHHLFMNHASIIYQSFTSSDLIICLEWSKFFNSYKRTFVEYRNSIWLILLIKKTENTFSPAQTKKCKKIGSTGLEEKNHKIAFSDWRLNALSIIMLNKWQLNVMQNLSLPQPILFQSFLSLS